MLGAYDAGRAALLARDARAALLQARAAPETGLQGATAALTRAREDLARAEALLERPLPRALAAVPVLGRSLDVEVAVVQAAASTLDAARTAADAVPALTGSEGRLLDPASLAALATDLEADSTRARDDLRALAALPLRGTPTVVARTARDARESLAPVVRGLRDASVGARLAASVLGSPAPRRVLVALQNNAELQGAGGYTTSFATATVGDGRVRLQPFRDVNTVNHPPARARRVPAPAEYVEDYGPFLADTTFWRTWTMSPDVPQVAVVGSRVAGALLGAAPDVVLLLDVPALAALAEVAGGVELDGRLLSGPALRDALLVDSYAEAGDGVEDQAARRRRLQVAASAALQRLLTSSDLPLPLLQQVSALAGGRHLALWSARPGEQAALERLGLTGSLGVGCADLLSINVNNLNGNKLDAYVERSVAVDAVVEDGSTLVRQRVSLANQAPTGLVDYVAGYDDPYAPLERVEFSVGPEAEVLSVTLGGQPVPSSVRRSADRVRVATTVLIRQGRTAELELRYRVPRGGRAYRLHLVPQPLDRDARLDVTLRPAVGTALQLEEGALHPAGGGWQGGGAFSTSSVVEVQPGEPTTPPGAWERLRRWWNSPL